MGIVPSCGFEEDSSHGEDRHGVHGLHVDGQFLRTLGWSIGLLESAYRGIGRFGFPGL